MRTVFQQRCSQAFRGDERADALRFSIAVFRRTDVLVATPETRLYVIHDEALDVVKIGIGRDPRSRLSTLQIGNARPLTLLLDVPAFAGLEKLIHRLLCDDRVQGEWFTCSQQTLIMCELLFSVDDFQRDVLRAGDPFDADFAIAVLAGEADEFLLLLEKDAA